MYCDRELNNGDKIEDDEIWVYIKSPGNIGGATYNSDGKLPDTLEPLGEGASNDEE